MAEANPEPIDATPPTHFPKQAVVVIHGIGEQIPMDTMKAFVHAAWETDAAITANGMPDRTAVWSKPDLRTGSLELRRITTRQSIKTKSFPNRVRTDFYELYWADLSAGSTLDAVENWIYGLLFRNPKTEVPPKVLSAWMALWVLSLAILYFLAAPIVKPLIPASSWNPYAWIPAWISVAIGLLATFVTNRWLLPYVGRVVRYTRATPSNIAARKDIRERGLKLLSELISPQAKPALLSFPFVPQGSGMMHWQMHHAAVFAATRWTNIYDPARFILCGDFISGPLKPLFG